MVGEIFNYLTVIKEWRNDRSQIICECLCECGNTSIVPLHKLKSQRIKSCGCKRNQLISKANSKHRGRNTILYSKWSAIKRRCLNPNDSHYHNYGGSGITICKEWKNSFEAFKEWSLSNGYKKDLTIERIDPKKGYSPSNCKWIEMSEQAKNKRNTVYIIYGGELKRIKEISDVERISAKTISSRYYRFIKRNPHIKEITYEMIEPTKKFKGTSYKNN